MTSLLSAIASSLALWPGLFLVAGGVGKVLDLSENRGENTIMARVLPPWLRLRPALALVAAAELSVGVLVVSAHWAPWPDVAAALLLTGAVLLAVWGLRNAPEADCGCFGALGRVVTVRTAVRGGVLAALAALAAAGGESWTSAFDHPQAIPVVLAAGVALAWLSVRRTDVTEWLREATDNRLEDAAFLSRRIRVAACERRHVSLDRTVARLRRTELWRRARPYISADAPTEHWEQGCWRLMTYPAVYEGEAVTAVFAVNLGFRQSANTVAFVNEADQRVLGKLVAKGGRDRESGSGP
jgi:methylamine utilization protein MauE